MPTYVIRLSQVRFQVKRPRRLPCGYRKREVEQPFQINSGYESELETLWRTSFRVIWMCPKIRIGPPKLAGVPFNFPILPQPTTKRVDSKSTQIPLRGGSPLEFLRSFHPMSFRLKNVSKPAEACTDCFGGKQKPWKLFLWPIHSGRELSTIVLPLDFRAHN